MFRLVFKSILNFSTGWIWKAFLIQILFLSSFSLTLFSGETNASVSAGENHSLLLRTDGSLWSMGKNDRGQLGDGSKLELGLVGWWKFDGDSTDSSGNGNVGTVNGATLTTDRHGQPNSAYRFIEDDEYFDTNLNISFPTVSVSFWVSGDSVGNLFNNGGKNGRYRESWASIVGGSIEAKRWVSDPASLVYNSENNWNHVVVLFDKNGTTIFLNGGTFNSIGVSTPQPDSLEPDGTFPNVESVAHNWLIGAKRLGDLGSFSGTLDDIRIYNRALSSTEVSALYTLESQPFSHQPARVVDANVTAIASGSETSYFIKKDGSLWGMGRNDRGQLGNAQGLDQGLVGWWKFDGDATDSSGNGNDGTVNGATLSTDRHGQASKAYSFDGVDDYISMTIGTYDEVTFSAWLKIASFDNEYPKLFDLGSSYPLFRIGFNGNRSDHVSAGIVGQMHSLRSSFSAHNSALSYGIQPIGSWINVVTSLGVNSFHSTFLDGIVIEQGSYKDSPSQDGSLKIGANNSLGSDHFFSGTVDDIRIYDRALSATEVSALYSLESQPEDPSASIQIVDSNVTAVSSRGSHALFQKSDGTLWAMGANDYGQLGDGTTTDRHTPRQVFAWEEKASNSLARAAFDGVEEMDGKLYFAGGGNVGNVHATFESFDPSTGSWQTLPSLNTARVGASMAVYNGKFLVFGGASASGPGNKLDSVEIYNSVTNSWTAGPNLPVACNYSVAVTYGDKILVFGGWDQAEDNMDQVLEFDPSLNTWSAKTSMPVGRSGMKAVVCGGKVWIMGGIAGVGINYSNRVDVYDPATDTWAQMPDLTVARHWALAWTLNGKVYIGGGRPDASTYLTTIESYDSSSNQWRIIGNLPARAYQSDSALINGKLYLTGGWDGSAHSNKLYITDLNPVTTFSAGGDHSRFVQADGSLWAMGRNHVGQLGDGTSTDRPGPVRIETVKWEEKASHSQARYAAYDGVEVIDGKLYFAGGSSATVSDTLERYDPSTNQWTALASMTQARSSQFTTNHNGLLYLFGGKNGSTLSSVEIYDPSSDSWSSGVPIPNPLSTTGVKAGDKVFLVSGANDSAELTQVLEFDLNSSVWTTKAPLTTARSGHVCAYYEGKIWAMGGRLGGTTHLDSVEIYDPATNSWTVGPSLTTPRFWAVGWVAKGRMYVAGGRSGASFLNTIESYNPDTNSWELVGNLPVSSYLGNVGVIDNKAYLIVGATSHGVYSDKFYVADYSPVTGVASGQSHGYYLKGSGDLWSMGLNADGQLGDGTTTNRNSPVQVLNGSNVSQVSAGSKEGYFTKIDGTTWSMGRNDFGQLGNTDTADQSTPAMVFGWEEKASHSQARYAFDGVEVIDGKLYFSGGSDGVSRDTVERYDPATNQWTTLASLNTARTGTMGAILNDQFFAIGGSSLSSIEIFNPIANSWSYGTSLPISLRHGRALSHNGKILVFGGYNGSTEVSDVREYDPGTEIWTSKASMTTARHGHQVAVYDKKIWIMGGRFAASNYLKTVEVYDPVTDSWSAGPNLTIPRFWPVAWVGNGQLFIGGGRNTSTYQSTIESYDPVSNSWEVVGHLPVSSYAGDVGVIGNQVYLAVGSTSSGVYSDKLYVSDLSPFQAVASNGSSNPNTILIKQDGTFWGMGRNDSGQIGDGSLSNRSYPVPIISSYTLVVNGAPEGNATGGGEWSIGSPVTLTATPNPGYLFAGWVGDLNSTDANVTLSPTGNLEVNATFTQDLNDNDDDNLTNFYEIVTLGTNADNNDTDGDGLLDGEEVGILGIDPLINNAPIVALFVQREVDAHAVGLAEGNASGQQYVYDFRSTFSLYNEAEVNASAQQRESNGSLTGEPLGRLYVQANPTEFNLYTEADLNASMDSERVRGLADGNQSGKNQVTANPSFYGLYTETEINATIASESIRGLADGNASGKAYVQTKRVIYSLYNGVDLNVSGTQFYSNAYTEGNTSGINYVNLYPNLFNLYTETDINNSRILSQQVGFNEGNLSGIAYLQANARQYGWYHISDKLQLEADARIRALVDGNTAGVNQVKNNPHSYDLNTTVEKETAEAFARSDGLNKGFSRGVQWAVDHPSLYSLYLPAEKVSLENSAYDLASFSGVLVGKDYVVNNRKIFDWINPVERTEMETNASRIAREAGRLSGIEKVKNSPNDYSLYSLADRNQKEAQAYSVGFTEGNASGIAYVFSNRLSYGLSADIERDSRILDSRQRGESEGIKAGRAQSVATAQADLSRHGLALVEYLETTEPTPYTYNWFYQPGAGWLWTDKSVFPYFYLSSSEGTQTGWLYYDSNRTDFPFYDYEKKTWKEIEP